MGQALSVRPDLVPPVYISTLETLQDKIPSFDTKVARELIELELGRRVGEMFEGMTEAPVAAASLGQVYKARLLEGGQPVAIKVQRPGITDGIAKDMLLLRIILEFLDSNDILPLTQPLVPIIDEFTSKLFGELDYVREGENCEQLLR